MRLFCARIISIAVIAIVLAMSVDKAIARGVVVPVVHGKTMASAKHAIIRSGLRIGRVTYATKFDRGTAAGRVIRPIPRGGTHLRRDSRVNLLVNRLHRPKPPKPNPPPPNPPKPNPRTPPNPPNPFTPPKPNRPTPPKPPNPPNPPTPPYVPPTIAACNEGIFLYQGDPGSWMVSHGASVVKVTIPSSYPTIDGSSQPMAYATFKDAEREGFRSYASFQFPNPQEAANRTPAQDVQWLKDRISWYTGLHFWAISIGNEQEHAMSAAFYRQVWDGIEPWLAANFPGTKLVFGEAAPWGFQWIKDAWGSVTPHGVAAVSIHDYHTTTGGLDEMPQQAAWAQSKGVPLWDSESGPGTINYARWLDLDTYASYTADLDKQLRASNNNVTLVSKYTWPEIGSWDPGPTGL